MDHPPEPCLDHCQISDVGRALGRNFEGYSPLRYRDSAGLWTIGVGQLIRPGEHFDEPLLGDAAEALFQKDLAPQVAAVNARVSVPLYQGQFDAAVSLVYNIGERAFVKSTALKKINAAQHEEVPAQIKRLEQGRWQSREGLGASAGRGSGIVPCALVLRGGMPSVLPWLVHRVRVGIRLRGRYCVSDLRDPLGNLVDFCSLFLDDMFFNLTNIRMDLTQDVVLRFCQIP